VVTVPASTSITNGYCAQWVVSGSVKTLGQASAACGSGGGGSGTVNSGAANQVACYASTGTTVQGCDQVDIKEFPAANCFNNAAAGMGWSTAVTPTCTNESVNVGGYIALTSSTSAQFLWHIPKDWDTSTTPYLSVDFATGDTNSAHTVIPTIQVGCAALNGTATDNPALQTAHSMSTVTLSGGTAHYLYESTVTMNSTDLTSCVAPGLMIVQVSRSGSDTGSATAFEAYVATITYQRKPVAQAN
jgi:hypothetical protein